MKPLSRSSLFGMTVTALICILLLIAIAIVILAQAETRNYESVPGLEKFKSDAELVEMFRNVSSNIYGGYFDIPYPAGSTLMPMPVATAVPAPATASWSGSTLGEGYSTTNVQVAGVDEADIIKTDGEYIYLVSGNKLNIVKAYPAGDAHIVSTTLYDNFTPQELFIKGDRLLVLGMSYTYDYDLVAADTEKTMPPYWHGMDMTSARLYDISNKSGPLLLKTTDVEGNYDTARLIGNNAYFVVNTYKYNYGVENLTAGNIIPLYREDFGQFKPVGKSTDISYIPPLVSPGFVTICSINITNGDIVKDTIAGSGSEVYVSQDNLYFTRSDNTNYGPFYGFSNDQNTTIVKLHLNQGKVQEAGSGKVPGHLLNQFSMDESDGHFRIATTRGYAWDSSSKSTSNVYVLDQDMKTVGALEGLAPGEEIYSTRFVGPRLYMVTFKKVDPLFVIDLSKPQNPTVLGKLKIPGYSDYLQPYDDTHIIGIGKDAVDASESEIGNRNLDFAWYQCVKMALFDVSNVGHPVEMYKVVIGDRGTDSPVLHDHRAFLFDKEKGLLVLPVTEAEILDTKTSDNQYGQTVFDGVYVYDVNLAHGFTLRGNVSQYGPGEVTTTALYYYGGNSIQRSLYIRNVLYTMSSNRLQLNDLGTLERLKIIELSAPIPVAMYDPSSSASGFYQFPSISNNTTAGLA